MVELGDGVFSEPVAFLLHRGFVTRGIRRLDLGSEIRLDSPPGVRGVEYVGDCLNCLDVTPGVGVLRLCFEGGTGKAVWVGSREPCTEDGVCIQSRGPGRNDLELREETVFVGIGL